MLLSNVCHLLAFWFRGHQNGVKVIEICFFVRMLAASHLAERRMAIKIWSSGYSSLSVNTGFHTSRSGISLPLCHLFQKILKALETVFYHCHPSHESFNNFSYSSVVSTFSGFTFNFLIAPIDFNSSSVTSSLVGSATILIYYLHY